jgi:ATP-dependent Clp protease ATP-binding subunit ClpA
VVFGQDEAIEALASAIKLNRSGLGDREKPIGSFLFAGPTGVGKTEVTAAGAHPGRGADPLRHVRVHGAAHGLRLIGAPPGYVGFDQGGLLTEEVDQAPALRAAARRDREGASGRLQPAAAGDGPRHADRQQRPQGDFRNVVLIMTTNAGAAEQAKAAIGFGRDRREGEDLAAIEKMFTPEFRNRLRAGARRGEGGRAGSRNPAAGRAAARTGRDAAADRRVSRKPPVQRPALPGGAFFV